MKLHIQLLLHIQICSSLSKTFLMHTDKSAVMHRSDCRCGNGGLADLCINGAFSCQWKAGTLEFPLEFLILFSAQVSKGGRYREGKHHCIAGLKGIIYTDCMHSIKISYLSSQETPNRLDSCFMTNKSPNAYNP